MKKSKAICVLAIVGLLSSNLGGCTVGNTQIRLETIQLHSHKTVFQINNNKCELKIDLLLKDKNGNVIQDEFDYEIYEDSHVPYKGFLYSIEYNKISIMKKAIKQLKTLNRNLYIQYNGCGSFDSI